MKRCKDHSSWQNLLCDMIFLLLVKLVEDTSGHICQIDGEIQLWAAIQSPVSQQLHHAKDICVLQVAFETGTSTSYALFSCQERGNLFLSPGVDVYKGQIIGIHQRPGDLSLNACKRKAATNVRSNKEATGNAPPSPFHFARPLFSFTPICISKFASAVCLSLCSFYKGIIFAWPLVFYTNSYFNLHDNSKLQSLI